MKRMAMSELFEKIRIKNMELKNRLVRSATHEGMSDPEGFLTQALFNLYERLAKGGIGLIITGYGFVSQDGESPFIGMQGKENTCLFAVSELVPFAFMLYDRVCNGHDPSDLIFRRVRCKDPGIEHCGLCQIVMDIRAEPVD
jgi:hypothetical protein